jgi:hypothetical protein
MDMDRPYWPRVMGGAPLRRYRFGPYRAVLQGDLVSLARVQYLYVLLVVHVEEERIAAYVASEVNEMHDPADPESGSHFLGLFPGTGHRNYGASNDWADLDKFAVAAVDLARRHLGVREKAEQVDVNAG